MTVDERSEWLNELSLEADATEIEGWSTVEELEEEEAQDFEEGNR